jgi:hypothetical protein
VDYNISQFQIVKFENITIGSGEISKLTKLEFSKKTKKCMASTSHVAMPHLLFNDK